ncbi:MAG: NADH-quinone oxidoreductase subunit NuoE [Candidatus Aminicenantaceae bacterium]
MKEILDEFTGEQKELIHILHKVQLKYGYIPPESVSTISKHLQISESEIFGVLTFYNAFNLEPRGKNIVKVCMGTACHVRGAPHIVEEMERELAINVDQTTPDKKFTLETVNCLGCCAIGPVVVVNDEYYSHVEVSKVNKIINEHK